MTAATMREAFDNAEVVLPSGFSELPEDDFAPQPPQDVGAGFGYVDEDGLWTAYGPDWEVSAPRQSEPEPYCSLDLQALASKSLIRN